MEDANTLELSPEERELRAQLTEAEAVLDSLRADLGSVEGEWQAVEDKRLEYEPLEQACRTLEQLEEAGLSRAFWGERASDEEVAAHLTEVRGRIAELGEDLLEIDERRQAARRKVNNQLDTVALIEGDLLQAIEDEERRLQEWVVEREESELEPRRQILPWARNLEDDALFKRTLLRTALVCLLLAFIIPIIDIPIPEREEITEVPERFARLIRKEPLRPMPEPQIVEEKKVEEKPPEPQEEPEVEPEVVPETQVAEVPAPQVQEESPRDRVASKGLLAFRESFSNLASGRPSARLGADARINDAGNTAVGLPERSMVAVEGPGSSGGINLSDLSRDVGSGAGAGDQIAGVALSRVASSIGPAGGSDRPLASGAMAGRTDEEIQIVFDRYKAALYRLYNKELRRDPTLKGQMVLRLTIEPDGSVSVCQLQSSDMNAPLLAEQVVGRVRGFDFGAKEVPAITILYPIDFLPTA
ncbi:MAG: AgmX/PglI C-terminal domain-containing protein [Gammaproteobacteria bacterium]|jgi:hypothetical protein